MKTAYRAPLAICSLLVVAVLAAVPVMTHAFPFKPTDSVGRVTATGKLGTRRFSQTATLLPNGKVLVTGGMEANGRWVNTAELYDPAAGTFAATGKMEVARACHTATLLKDGQVLIAGGSDGSGLDLASAELYDPARGTFRATGNLTGPRCSAVAVRLNNGKVLLIGGDGVREDERVATAELYDPATGRFTAAGSMHVPRATHVAVLLKDGRVLVVGGSSAGRYPGTHIEASAEIYDPATGKFTVTGSMSSARYKAAAALLPDGRVLVVGGSDNRDWRGQYTSAEIYNPASGKFAPASDMNFKRYKLMHSAVALPNGRILIAGGAEHPEVYDPATNRFQPVTGSVGGGRYFSSATVLADGRVLIAGGYGEDPMAGGVTDAWIYQP